jgi:hypothetical protein
LAHGQRPGDTRSSTSYVVWLYYRFNLSHRDIEDLLAERGISMENMAHAFNMGILYNGGGGVYRTGW